jgi:hypothetical protein
MNLSKKKIFFLTILIAINGSIYKAMAQENLVLNPSFEQLSDTIYGKHRRNGSLGGAGRLFCDQWIIPGNGSPDMLHGKRVSVFGMPAALARTGEGRAGFIAASGPREAHQSSYKEYIQGRFSQALDSGKTYQVSFYLSLDRGAYHYAENLGALISCDSIRQHDYFGIETQPQIKYQRKPFSSRDGWVRICGSFQAKGGERFITIGSFDTRRRIDLREAGLKAGKKNLRWKRYAYYYLDDVSVTESSSNPACSSYQPGTSRDWIFLLDASASMLTNRKWELMPETISKALSIVQPQDRVSLIFFNDSARTILNQVSPLLVRSEEIFRAIKPEGGTEIRNALHLAYRDTLQRKSQASVVLITDAQFPGGRWSDGIRSAYEKYRTSFHAITIGENRNPELDRLTEACGGRYLYTGKNFTGNELAAIVHKEVRAREKVKYGKGQFYKTQTFVMISLIAALVLIQIL